MAGRVLFGSSAVMCGVIDIVWRDSEMWRLLPIHAPVGTTIGWCLAIAQIVAGIGMFHPRTLRGAAIVLGVVYLLFTLACVPGIARDPANYGEYVDIFELFAVVCGALAVYAATELRASRSAALGRAARIGLGVCALSFALSQVVYLHYTAGLIPSWFPLSHALWTILTTIAFALAAVAMLVDRQALLAIRLMALMVALFGLLVWVPQIVAGPRTLSNWSEFALNYLIAGAAWMVSELGLSFAANA